MSKVSGLSRLFHRAASATPKQDDRETAEGAEKLTRELAAAELETRFREALRSGKITGDVITTDDQGNVVKNTQSTNIFDL